MEKITNIAAAQYVRMSTEDQQYSIDNQTVAINKFAEQHGFSIIRTYSDAGKSGVVLKHRPALAQLLTDVVGGRPPFEAILVYDISRWGRFQDTDESAHYEYLCRNAGIQVHYCAEPFVNDGTPPNSMLKALKRSMAAEYSRELGMKVFEGKCRIVKLGFRVGGPAGLGLRRMLISANGVRKCILRDGEHKNLVTDRVILVLGPKSEVRSIREIYDMYLTRKMNMTAIARELNFRRVWNLAGKPWTSYCVKGILTQPKYCGANVWGRLSTKLQRPVVQNPKEDWATKEGAFAAIIDPKIFQKVQDEIRRRTSEKPDVYLLSRLRRLLNVKGKLTSRIISSSRAVPSNAAYTRRFGSLQKAYDAIGYRPSARAFLKSAHNARRHILVRELVANLQRLFPDHIKAGRYIHLKGPELMVDGQEIPIVTCRAVKHESHTIWLFDARSVARYKVTLVCLIADDYDNFERLYLVPSIGTVIQKYRWFHKDDLFFKHGQQVFALGNFYSQVKEIRRSCAVVGPRITLFDDPSDY